MIAEELWQASAQACRLPPWRHWPAEPRYQQLAITANDIAEVIAFAVTRPRRMTLNEILVRPTAQP